MAFNGWIRKIRNLVIGNLPYGLDLFCQHTQAGAQDDADFRFKIYLTLNRLNAFFDLLLHASPFQCQSWQPSYPESRDSSGLYPGFH